MLFGMKARPAEHKARIPPRQVIPPPLTSNMMIQQRLLLTRTALGLNQTEFAGRADIATNTYNQWEKKGCRPSLDEAIKLVEAHGLTLDWIYRGVETLLPGAILDKIRQHSRRIA